MAPAAASLLSADSSVAAAASKRPAASDAEPLAQEATRKNHQKQLECPRCGSSNTKFCYYNNYSTAQPRHFCRACRRYWTHGGTLRKVPVGGACRHGGNKRRRVGSGADQPSSASPTPPTSARAEDAYPDLPTTFPFLSDGVFLPQFDLGGVGPAGFSWPSAPIPDFYDGLTASWGDGTLAAGVTGAWDDITGLELSWPPPAGN